MTEPAEEKRHRYNITRPFRGGCQYCNDGTSETVVEIEARYYERVRVLDCTYEEEVFLVRASCWAAIHDTNGQMHVRQFRFLGMPNARQLADRLVEYGLMEKEDDVYVLV